MKKNKMRKQLLFWVILIVVTCIVFGAVTLSVFAKKKSEIPIPTVKEDVYVYDSGDIIDNNVEKELNELLTKLEKQTKAEVAVVTVTSLLDMEIEDYSYELANTLGIGKAKEDNGVLLLISKTDTKVRLEIGKGLEGCLNDSKCGRILDDYFVPYREKDEYSEGTKKTIEAVVSVIAKEYDTTIGEIDAGVANELEESESYVWLWILLIIILLVVFFAVMDSSTGGTYSGGSFRSGGGSSFGGFGGGGFGGGGASR